MTNLHGVGLVVQDLETLRKLLPLLTKAPASNGNHNGNGNGNGYHSSSSSPTNGHNAASSGNAHQASLPLLTPFPLHPGDPTLPPPPPL